MSVLESIALQISKKLIDVLSSKRLPKPSHWDSDALSAHLVEVANWSDRIEFFGFGRARHTDSDSIGLSTALPRKLQKWHTRADKYSERELLTATGHYLLLGDPGAGKTTTLKRLVRTFLQQSPLSDADQIQYPIVVRLRELDAAQWLEEALCRAVGLKYERRTLETSGQTQQPEMSGKTQQHDTKPSIQAYVGDVPCLDAVSEIIDSTKALVVLDGMDEINPALRERTETTIKDLARKTVTARILVSCRSGDYNHIIPGFDTLEICALTSEQIAEVANRWCEHPSEFLQRLEKLPFSDLATRPLFLCELIVLFETRGFIPSQPAGVYRRIVLLALEEWDRQKPDSVQRQSRYSQFDP